MFMLNVRPRAVEAVCLGCRVVIRDENHGTSNERGKDTMQLSIYDIAVDNCFSETGLF
jgi:hypothetical protein